jgi:hypothetical protein
MVDLTDHLWDELNRELDGHVYISRDQFERGLKDWNVTPHEIDGELAYVTMSQGPEFHVSSFGTGRTISMAMIRANLAPLLDLFGYVTTSTPKDDRRQHALNRRFGFREVGESEFFIHFRLDRPCQLSR